MNFCAGLCGLSSGSFEVVNEPVSGGITPSMYPSGIHNVARAIPFTLKGAASIESLGFFATELKNNTAIQLAIYSAQNALPWKQILLTENVDISDESGWYGASVPSKPNLQPGSYYALLYYQGSIVTHAPRGTHVYLFNSQGLPKQFDANSKWLTSWQGGFPLAVKWTPVSRWCDVGSSLPPVLQAHVGDSGPGRLNDIGDYLSGNRTVYKNFNVQNNTFIIKTGVLGLRANTLQFGAIDGLVVRNNIINDDSETTAYSDFSIYSSSRVVSVGNVCQNSQHMTRACNTTTVKEIPMWKD